MCTRYISPETADIERFWHIGRRNNNNPWRRAEVFPRGMGVFLRGDSSTKGLELVTGQWGLIPHFAKTPNLTYSTNNARSEELASKHSFRKPWSQAPAAPGTAGATGITDALGVAAWVVFVFWLHGWLIGVRPMG